MSTESETEPVDDGVEQAEPEEGDATPSSDAEDPDPLAEAEAKLAALKEQLMRTAADFDNYRKRARREVEDALRGGREGMLKDLLPVFDNLERATAHAESAADLASFASGIEMVMRQFHDTLKRTGIERVPSVGVAFDPTVHEAIQQVESSEHAPGTITAEVQGGFRLGDRLIRPAMVIVARAAAPETASDEPPWERDAEGEVSEVSH